jgi:hypothetical protein
LSKWSTVQIMYRNISTVLLLSRITQEPSQNYFWQEIIFLWLIIPHFRHIVCVVKILSLVIFERHWEVGRNFFLSSLNQNAGSVAIAVSFGEQWKFAQFILTKVGLFMELRRRMPLRPFWTEYSKVSKLKIMYYLTLRLAILRSACPSGNAEKYVPQDVCFHERGLWNQNLSIKSETFCDG